MDKFNEKIEHARRVGESLLRPDSNEKNISPVPPISTTPSTPSKEAPQASLEVVRAVLASETNPAVRKRIQKWINILEKNQKSTS